MNSHRSDYCTSCYTGHYPVPFPTDQASQLTLPLQGRDATGEGRGVRSEGATPMDYKSSGVDIDAGNEVVRRIKGLARSTFTPGVLSEIGSFGGLFRLEPGRFADPVMVASADGVGTKLKVAFLANRHDTVGEDLVNHCVNDILVQGARPLFFLDYLATGRLAPDVAEQIVTGIARGCRSNGCALLGGETAEMPGFYAEGEYDLAGFIVGAVDRAAIVNGSTLQPGDVLIGLPSTGLHTNGYSLARRIVFEGLGLRRGLGRARAGDDGRRGAAGGAPVVPDGDRAAARRAGPRSRPRPHHRRRDHRQPAAHLPERASAPASTAARGRCRRCSSSCGRPGTCPTTTCTGRSTWASA